MWVFAFAPELSTAHLVVYTVLVTGYLLLLWNCIYLALSLVYQLITNKLDQQKQGIVSISDTVWPTWF